jgi:hypothetical protein
MKKTVDKIPFYRLGWNKTNYFRSTKIIRYNYSMNKGLTRISWRMRCAQEETSESL